MRSLLAVVLALSLLPVVQADAVYFTDDLVSYTTTPGCGSDIPTWGSSLDAPEGADAGKAFPSFANAILTCASYFTFTADQDYELIGEGSMLVYYSCEAATNLFNLYFDLLVAGTVVGEASLRSDYPAYMADPTTCTPGDVFEFELPIPTSDALLPAGAVMNIRFDLEEGGPNPTYTTETGTGNAHFRVYSAATPSGFYHSAFSASTEPVRSVTVYDELEGDSVDLDQQFVVPQANTYRYNWTGPGPLTGALNVSVDAGSVEVSIKDDAGTEHLNVTLTESSADALDFEGVAGQWVISLAYDGFIGSVSLQLDEPMGSEGPADPEGPDDPDEPASTPGEEDADPEGNTTEDGGGKESPGLPVAALVLGLVLLAARRR